MKKSQTERILNWLKRKPLNPMQALREFGCFRLAARINELRQDGHRIETERVATKDGSSYARYRLIEEERKAA